MVLKSSIVPGFRSWSSKHQDLEVCIFEILISPTEDPYHSNAALEEI